MKIRKHRIALLVHYDGTGFNGWQVQNKGKTIQGEIENALKILTGEKIRIFASGRTDAGVHALGQVAHFDLDKDISLRKICAGLNGILDRNISVTNAYYVPSGFHARYSALQREYLYLIFNHKQKSPFMINRALWVREELDLDFFRIASGYLIGEYDYTSFCKKGSSEKNTIRRIENINVTEQNHLIMFKVKGNSFLHNMVRIMVGTILEMSMNNISPSYMQEILEKRDRKFSGKTAPSYGLYLTKISFDIDLSEMESAF